MSITSLRYGACVAAARGVIACAALVVVGCATPPTSAPDTERREAALATPLMRDAQVEDRILALDPQHISESDVRTVLDKAPTPQIILIHGGVLGTNLLMRSFARFLIGMGYPEQKIRAPSDGAYSQSPYGSSERLAGEVAWYYERDGVRPMMVGHSQGGIQAVKVLYELNGAFNDKLAVWDPKTDTRENRDTIVDPLTGADRPVLGAALAYVSVVGAGGVALFAPVHWGMAQRLHTIPNTVEDFTGFSIEYDLIAWTFPGPDTADLYHHNGTATVRNVSLPGSYSHIFVPITQALASDPKMRAWLNDFVPDQQNRPPPDAKDGRDNNAFWAADVWFSVKMHWCIEAQRLIRARRAALRAH